MPVRVWEFKSPRAHIMFTEQELSLINQRVYAHVATISAIGNPQVSPVWIGFRNNRLCFSTVKGRAKYNNIKHNSKVAVSIIDPSNGSNYIQIIGTASIENDIDELVIEEICRKYMGEQPANWREKCGYGERVTVYIDPIVVSSRFNGKPRRRQMSFL